MTALLYRVLRACWLATRRLLELFVSRERLDAWLESRGFFRWKDRAFAFKRRLPDGTVLLIHPDDEKILREIHEDGCYARGRIEDGDVVVDVGAHVGVFTVYAARKTPRGRVIAVEPAPPNRELLRRNAAGNGLTNVTILDCALSDRAGEARLHFPGDHALYTLRPAGPTPVSHPVRVRTLDEVFAEQKIALCHLLKIDAERSELEILRGAARALDATRQLLVEAGKDDGAHEKVIALLRGRGFTCSTQVDTPGGIVLYASREPDRVA